MKLTDFDYTLPPERIARYPTEQRSGSRLLCLDRRTGERTHRCFSDLPSLLAPNDLLVLNDTRVIPARLWGRKPTGGRLEILVERILDERRLLAHIRGGKSLRKKSPIHLGNAVLEVGDRSGALFELVLREPARPVSDLIDELGSLPLPPYLQRLPDATDPVRYQTVFARQKGAVAAPTAGLHFDEALLQILRERGIRMTFVTLHIGAGTFAPVRTEDIREHAMHAERIEVASSVCEAIHATRQRGGRVIAVGTTTLRSLETVSVTGQPLPFSGDTSIFIYPGHVFRGADMLLTNFHLPRSTLLMLVSAFAGRENILSAYAEAIKEQYRFFSYGDAMLIG